MEVLPSETLDLGRRLIWKKGILGWIGAGPLLHCSTGGPGIWLVWGRSSADRELHLQVIGATSIILGPSKTSNKKKGKLLPNVKILLIRMFAKFWSVVWKILWNSLHWQQQARALWLVWKRTPSYQENQIYSGSKRRDTNKAADCFIFDKERPWSGRLVWKRPPTKCGISRSYGTRSSSDYFKCPGPELFSSIEVLFCALTILIELLLVSGIVVS